jgi:hypothetical protein
MGGSKVRDVPSNIIVICSWLNSAMESDSKVAAKAKELGWKLQAGDNPELEPVYHYSMQWRILDNVFGFHHDIPAMSRLAGQLRVRRV